MARRERKTGRAVVKGGSQPTVKLVTALAVSGGERRSRAGMGRVRCLLPIFQVARIAARREAVKYSRGRLLVAFLALHRGVRTQQRKAVLVLFHLLYCNIPSLHGVTLLAVRSHLPAVDVRVTVRAILSHIREHRLDVALHAFHFFVHSTQRIFCLVVIEFGRRAWGANPRRCDSSRMGL